MRAIMLFLVFGLFADVYGAGLDDLVNALNTTRAIWLYNRSYDVTVKGGNQICVRWQLENLTRSSYDFQNSFKVNKTYYEENRTHATLFEKGEDTMMNVSYQSGKPTTYTLKLWNSTEKCFLLTIHEETGTGTCDCELHLWQEKLREVPTSCNTMYQNICKAQEHEVFSEHECM
ncbi:uncharacterized protein LOC125945854 [Dermacentor silvarum]|uniref:uncharacterized protein LOC125945854 n=1 Tax=Dermacentor silvarum TaxID=543639 RepID=UPI002101BC7A|nr:uncharacterized protein LOC125945854 [Dermacentor silvarum]